MDNISEIFSPEALRLLEESGFDYGTVLQPDRLPAEYLPSTIPTPRHVQTKKRPPQSLRPIPGCSSVSSNDLVKAKRKRAKFPIKAREKVAAVRKKGACLRCRALKLPCSGTWPCASCLHNQTSCHSRESKYKWMECVPHWFRDLDIYTLDFPCNQEQYDSILQTNNVILSGNANRSFDPEVSWELGAIASDCAEWILDESVKPGSNSRIWMFSSFDAERLLSTYVDGDLSKAVRILVETSSILRNWGMDTSYSHYSASDLWSIRSFAGSQVLQGLERALNVQRLAKSSADVLKALFLVMLGTVIAVGYSASVIQSEESFNLPHMTATAFLEAQRQLLRILAHHMIQIAQRAHVLDEQTASGRILENAYRLWNGKAVFQWEIVQFDYPIEPEENSHYFSSSGKNTQENCWAGISCSSTAVNLTAASSRNPLSDIITSDSFDRNITGANEKSTLGRCVLCNSRLDANGLCQACLLLTTDFPINDAPDDLGNPPQCQKVWGTQTSAMTSSTPYPSDEWICLDPPGFLAVNSGAMSPSSPRPGVDTCSTPYQNPSWHDFASGTSNLNMPWIESAPIPLTYGISGFASPTNACNYSSSGPMLEDGRHKENIASQQRHLQEILSCVPARISEFPLYAKKRRLRTLAHTDELCRLNCIEGLASHVASRSVCPDELEHLDSFGCSTSTRQLDGMDDGQWEMKLWSNAWSPIQLRAGSDIADFSEGSKAHRGRLRVEEVAKRKFRELLV